jgi:hypothetical protein
VDVQVKLASISNLRRRIETERNVPVSTALHPRAYKLNLNPEIRRERIDLPTCCRTLAIPRWQFSGDGLENPPYLTADTAEANGGDWPRHRSSNALVRQAGNYCNCFG